MNNLDSIKFPIQPNVMRDQEALEQINRFSISGNDAVAKAVVRLDQDDRAKDVVIIATKEKKVTIQKAPFDDNDFGMTYNSKTHQHLNHLNPLGMEGFDTVLKEKFGFTLNDVLVKERTETIEINMNQALGSKPGETEKLEWFRNRISDHVKSSTRMLAEAEYDNNNPEVKEFYSELNGMLDVMENHVPRDEFDWFEKRVYENLGMDHEWSLLDPERFMESAKKMELDSGKSEGQKVYKSILEVKPKTKDSGISI